MFFILRVSRRIGIPGAKNPPINHVWSQNQVLVQFMTSCYHHRHWVHTTPFPKALMKSMMAVVAGRLLGVDPQLMFSSEAV